MNNDYFSYQKCVDDLTTTLSVGYFFKYSYKVIEKRISQSKYFSSFNKECFVNESYVSTQEVIESIYYDASIDDSVLNITYDELEWVSMAYINIIKNNKLCFEAIFCYAPIEKMMELYHLYHELDFSKIVEWFNEERKKTSIIKLSMKNLNISNAYLANKTNISLSMIDALKNRRRDIKKLDVERALALANTLNIKIETLLSN